MTTIDSRERPHSTKEMLAVSALLLGVLPAPARLAWRLIGRRQYTRRTNRIRAYLT